MEFNSSKCRNGEQDKQQYHNNVHGWQVFAGTEGELPDDH